MEGDTLTDSHISSLISNFKIDAQIASVKPFGSGHINDTYRIINCDPNGIDYLLQRINHNAFKDVPALMQNLVNVTNHIKQKLSVMPGSNIQKQVLTIVETQNGEPYFKDEGDNIRTIINTITEDEADLKLIGLKISLFEAYTQGYLQEAIDFLTET